MTLGLDVCLYLATGLFAIGMYGILARQNLLIILMSLEIMLNAVNLALIGIGRAFLVEGITHANFSMVMVIMVLAVAAAEAAVGLAILLAVYRRWRTTNSGEIDTLKG